MALVTMDFASDGGSKTADLIYTNPNPNSSFSAQTISSASSGWKGINDLSKYTFFIVETYYNSSLPHSYAIIENKTNQCLGVGYPYTGSGTNYGTYGQARSVSCNSNSFVFGNAYNNGNVVNDRVVPVKIYGIKDILPS